VPFDNVKDEWLINASSRQRLLLVINFKKQLCCFNKSDFFLILELDFFVTLYNYH